MAEGPYVKEDFTEAERSLVGHHFTNTDLPVFCLTDLPEAVKGALFARYSRTQKSLRRLYLDEFAGRSGAGAAPGGSLDACSTGRAEQLYDRVLGEFGDDSVAHLGSVHVACEQVSQLLVKVIERPRVGAAYLEKSTRYVPFTALRPDGTRLYYRDPAILASPAGDEYVRTLDGMFAAYDHLVPLLTDHFGRLLSKDGVPDGAWKATVRAKALDAVRGLLPAATLTNVGAHGTGQMMEGLMARMAASPLPEVSAYRGMMLPELRKVIPDFLKRVDVPDRGGAWSVYLEETRRALADLVESSGYTSQFVPKGLLDRISELCGSPLVDGAVRLVEWDRYGEERIAAAILYPHSDLPLSVLRGLMANPGPPNREGHHNFLRDVIIAGAGHRSNRRHRPGRGFEAAQYTFDVVGDYGVFRDLQRHRLCTTEWQQLTPGHGYDVPEAVDEAGGGPLYREQMARSAALWERLRATPGLVPEQAQYAVALGYKVRFLLSANAREMTHIIELRTQPGGHPAYRSICQAMYRLIACVHPTVAEVMRFADLSGAPDGRLAAEVRAQLAQVPS